MLKKAISTAFVLFSIFASTAVAQSDSIKERIRELGIAPMELRSTLSIESDAVAEIKTDTRKRKVRIGEMISVDVAFLNISSIPIYHISLKKFVRLGVHDHSGKVAPIFSYGTVTYDISSKDFPLLQPGGFSSYHRLLIVGCESTMSSMEEEGFYENDFVNRGQGCIKISEPGRYYVTASLFNNLVVAEPGPKTVVGRLESQALEIIVER